MPLAIDVRFLSPKLPIDTRSLVVTPCNAPSAEFACAKQGYRNRAKQKHALQLERPATHLAEREQLLHVGE